MKFEIYYIFGVLFLKPSEVGDCYAFVISEIQPHDKRLLLISYGTKQAKIIQKYHNICTYSHFAFEKPTFG